MQVESVFTAFVSKIISTLLSRGAFDVVVSPYTTARARVLDIVPDQVLQRVPFFTGSPRR
jgi:hypothetical protein